MPHDIHVLANAILCRRCSTPICRDIQYTTVLCCNYTIQVSALRLIGRVCPSYMYYCGYGTAMDQWAPKFHMEELEQHKADGVVPQNIHLEYNDNLVHAFIVSPPMIDPVVDYIIRSIGSSGSGGRAVDRQTQTEAEESSSLRSKL